MTVDNDENKNDKDNNNKDNEDSANMNIVDLNEVTTSNVKSIKDSGTTQTVEDDSSDDVVMIQTLRNNEIFLLEPEVRRPYVTRDVVSMDSVANTEDGVTMIRTAQAMSPTSSKKSKASTTKKKKQLPLDGDEDSEDKEEYEDYYSVQSDSSSEQDVDNDDEKSVSATKEAEQGGKSGGKKRPMTPKKGTASTPKPKRKRTPLLSSKKALQKNEGKQKARKTPPRAAKT